MKDKPTGLVTFLFTDIEGSTRLAQEFPDSLPTALEKHHAIMHKVIESNNGFVFEIVGDAFCCAFENAEDAIKAAVDAQINLANEKWDDVKIRIRIGIHSGNAEWNGKRYMGYITLARTARVMSSAYGEQIIVSNDTFELAKEKFQNKISFRDLGERRLKDLKQPVKLFQILSKGLRVDFPPLKTLDARPNNLPVQLTSFIGREAEMKTVKDLLKQTHLLTLTGSGGAGKTRLALQVAADVIDDFANGVWFVELASLFEPALIPQAIMKVFEIKEEQKRSLEDTLCDYLRDKEMLIILDNCEHLVEECAKLTEKLLSNSPKLKIMATSREALRCEGEQTHRVLSLEVPDPKDQYSPERLSQYEAVRLFIERALSVNATFRINNNNTPALAQICFQLDGIPLAIELAAARTKVLAVEQIYERLNDRFNLLTGGKRTALPRQQTLRALIDWSYDLLSENEKILWSRLSVFSGGWTLEAAEKVCSDETISKNDILELLSQLTEKSVIIYDEAKDRYRILETIKQYGIEKLPDGNGMFLHHLNYFLELSEKAEPELQKEYIKFWLDIIDAEHNNFISAINWSVNNETGKGALVAVALGGFWNTKGHYSTGIMLIKNILQSYGALDKSLKSKVLFWIAVFKRCQGDYEQAKKYSEESLAVRKEIGDKKGIAVSMNNLGNISNDQGDYEQAKKYYKESLAIRKEIGDKNGIAVSMNNLGCISNFQGDYKQAKKYYKESLAISKEIGDKREIAVSMNNLGNLSFRQGDYEQAKKYCKESLAACKEIGDKKGIVYSMTNLGNISIDQGDYKQAKKYYKESVAISKEIGDKIGIAVSTNNLGNISYHQGDYEQAKKYYKESLAISKEIGDKKGIAVSMSNLGNISNDQGDYEQAKKYYKESLAVSKEIGNKFVIAVSMNELGNIANYQGDYQLAVKLFSASEKILESMGVLELDDQIRKDETIAKLIEQLSDKEFNKYWEEGKKLTLEQAAELALSNIK